MLRTRAATSAAAPAAKAPSSSATGAESTLPPSKYRFCTKQGSVVSVLVQPGSSSTMVTISISKPGPQDRGTPPVLHWGMHRASLSKWYHPKEVVPEGSSLDSATGGMHTPAAWNVRAAVGAWEVQLQVPAKLAPVNLSMLVYHPETKTYETPAHGTHLCVPIGMSPGSAAPLGISLAAAPTESKPGSATHSVNFSVFSRNASGMSLVLVRAKQESDGSFCTRPCPLGSSLVGSGYLEIALDPVLNKTGDIWHVRVDNMKNIGSMCYGWRADGNMANGQFDPGFVLLDPYATRASPIVLPETYWNTAPKQPPYINMEQPVVMGCLSALTDSFDWQGAHRPLPMETATGTQGRVARTRSLDDSVVCNLDVAAFTRDASVPVERRGKLTGVLDRLPLLVEAGVTAVVLHLVCACGPDSPAAAGQAARRTPLALFAPDPALALGGPLAAAQELKQVIRAMHAVGLEVLLGLEFCITAEVMDPSKGNFRGMNGLDKAVYFRSTGPGTSVLCTGSPVVKRMVLDCLHHWADEYHVDGFCLLNAENLVQDQFGAIMDNPALAEEVAHDPILRHLKLVAALGSPSLLPRNGQRGFPHWGVWAQWNDRYTGDMRSYLGSGSTGMLSAIATRITGSADLFAGQWDAGLPGCLAAARRPAFSINAVQAPGDVSLPLALAHQLDPLTPEAVAGAAEVLARTLLLAQFTSCGTPCLSASTLGGSQGLARFVGLLAAVRRGYADLLSPPAFDSPRSLQWHNASSGNGLDWEGTSSDPLSNVIAFSVSGSANRAVYVAFNPLSRPVTVTLPAAPEGCCAWRQVVDTAAVSPMDASLDGPVAEGGALLKLAPRGGLMCLAVAGPMAA